MDLKLGRSACDKSWIGKWYNWAWTQIIARTGFLWPYESTPMMVWFDWGQFR